MSGRALLLREASISHLRENCSQIPGWGWEHGTMFLVRRRKESNRSTLWVSSSEGVRGSVGGQRRTAAPWGVQACLNSRRPPLRPRTHWRLWAGPGESESLPEELEGASGTREVCLHELVLDQRIKTREQNSSEQIGALRDTDIRFLPLKIQICSRWSHNHPGLHLNEAFY